MLKCLVPTYGWYFARPWNLEETKEIGLLPGAWNFLIQFPSYLFFAFTSNKTWLIIWYLSTLLIHQDLSTLLPLWRCWVPCLTHRDSLCTLKLSKNTHILQLHHRKQTRNARSGQRSQKGEVLDPDPKWWKERSNLSSKPYIHVCLSMYIFVCT